MLVTFEPKMLPMDTPTSWDNIADVEMDSSGRLVATDRTINPITNCPNLVIFEIFIEEFTTT